LWIDVIKDFAVSDAELVLEYLLTDYAYLPVHASAVDNVLNRFWPINIMRVSYYGIITVAAFNLNLFACFVNHNVSSHAVAVMLGEKNWEFHLFCVFIDLRFKVCALVSRTPDSD
jgi:hypothetical protein